MKENSEFKRLDNDSMKYYIAPAEPYTLNEVSIFVDSIMSNMIKPEWILKCLTALALQMEISDEEYESCETDEDGMLETFKSSKFIEFIDDGLVMLLYDKDPGAWVVYFRDYLIKLEQYETLHYLKLEERDY